MTDEELQKLARLIAEELRKRVPIIPPASPYPQPAPMPMWPTPDINRYTPTRLPYVLCNTTNEI